MNIALESFEDCVWQPSFFPSVCFNLPFLTNAALLFVFLMGVVAGACLLHIWRTRKPSPPKPPSQSGSIFFVIFGAVAMAGILGATVMTTVRGPVTAMSKVTQRTIAENNMIASGKLAIMAASNQPNGGDCDGDNTVEPVAWSTTGTGPTPAGGGYLPTNIGAALMDPWGTTYGYCAWDHGVAIQTTCPTPTLRLRGAGTGGSGPVIAIISAGPDKVFQTTCANAPAYVGRVSGSDDIVMDYTYAEAQALSSGLWNLQSGNLKTAEIAKDLEVKNQGGNVVFGVDSSSDPDKPSIKVDFIQKLSTPAKGVEFLSNIVLGNNWISGDGDAEGIRINSDGNVGIGTTAPEEGLTVAREDGRNAKLLLRTYGDSSNTSGVYLWTARGTSAAPSYLLNGQTIGNVIWYDYERVASAAKIHARAMGNWANGVAPASLEFFTRDASDTASRVRMMIDEVGNVGIGTSPAYPAYKLHVVDNTTSARAVYGQATATTGTNYGVYGSAASPAGYGVYSQGPMASTGSVTATGFFHSSDRNLKTGIEQIADPFALLNGINGKRYAWKDTGKAAYGVIAQDVEVVMPEAIGANDAGFKTVDYDQLVAPLIEAVKALKAENAALHTRLEALEAVRDTAR